MNMNQPLKAGFSYRVEIVDKRTGQVRESEVIKNLMPVEGIDHLINVSMKQGAQVAAWYIGLYEGNYTPASDDVMATFPTAATESTAYTPSTRPAFVPGAVSAGTVSNGASRAEFTFTSAKTLYGGFMSSASAKGSTSGILLSAVRFSSPKVVGVDDVLRITAGFTIASA